MKSRLIAGMVLAATFAIASEEPQAAALKEAGNACVGFGVPGHGIVAVRNNLAYVPPGEGDFTILDVSDKSRPRVAGYIVSPYFSYRIYFFKNLGYFQNSRGGTFFADLSSPSSTDEVNNIVFYLPRKLAFDDRAHGFIRHIDESKKIMVTAANDRLEFFNLDDPLAPRKVAEAKLPGVSVGETIQRNAVFFPSPGRAVFQSGTRLKENHVYGVDFSDPEKPQLIHLLRIDTDQSLPPTPDDGKIGLAGEDSAALIPALDEKKKESLFSDVILSCASHDKFCLLLSGDSLQKPREVQVYSFDFSGTKPERVAIMPVPPGCGKHLVLAFHGNSVYLLDGKGGPGQYSIGYDHPPDGAGNWYAAALRDGRIEARKVFSENVQTAYGYVTIDGGHAYVNDYNFGVRIFDLSNPDAPRQVGSCPTAGEGSGVYVDNARKIAFLWVTFGGTIFSIDVSDPARPRHLGRFHDGSWIQYRNESRAGFIDGKDGIIYCGKSRLQMLDARDPANMVHHGFLPGPEKSGGCRVKVSGDSLYVLSNSRLSILDVKDAAAPEFIGALDLPAGFVPISMTLRNGMIYAMGTASKFLAFDARNPAKPSVAGSLDLREHAGAEENSLAHISVSAAGYGYVTSKESRNNTKLLVLDLRSPSEPKTVGWVDSESAGNWGWACNNSNMTIDDERSILFVCKYMQVERFDIAEPGKPRFISKLHLVTRGNDDWQWVIGPAFDGRLYVPTLRALYVLEYD